MCGAVAVLSLAGVIALPFFPWIVLAAAVGAVGIIVYEIVRFISLPKAMASWRQR